MKTITRVLFLLCCLILSTTGSFAKETEEIPFSQFSDNDYVEYTYFSPHMLKGLGTRKISGDTYSVSANNLTTLIMIKSIDENTTKKVLAYASKLIKDGNYELLSSKKRMIVSQKMYGVMKKNSDFFKSVLIIDTTAASTTITYLIGDISLNDAY